MEKEEEPPDPGGEGLQIAYNVVIDNYDSSIDTDASVASSTRSNLKRQHSKRCRNCNNKVRKSKDGASVNPCDCQPSKTPLLQETPSHPLHTNVQVTKSAESPDMNLNKDKSTKVGRDLFSPTDAAPFTVHVQVKQTERNSSLHPVSFGKFLMKSKFNNIVNGSVKRIGRTRISMAFSKYHDANLFLNDSRLEAENLTAFIPSFTVTRMGLVRGIPAEWTEQDIIENISVPAGCGKVLKVRRLNHRVPVNGSVTWQPSETIVITFDGQILPKKVFSCYNSLPVDLYIFPTIQCFNCCKFGHTKTNCRSKPKCFKCGQMHAGHTCTVEEDCASCCLCNGFHFATNRSCPEHKRQKDIKVTMANNHISYGEAVKLHPSASKSFADVLQTRPQPQLNSSPSHSVPTLASNPTTQPNSTSYRKTIILKPRNVLRKTTKGYDVAAHNALISGYSIPPPQNGCALRNPDKEDSHPESEDIQALISLLSNPNISLPSHVAPLAELLLVAIKNNGQNNSMELQECSK